MLRGMCPCSRSKAMLLNGVNSCGLFVARARVRAQTPCGLIGAESRLFYYPVPREVVQIYGLGVRLLVQSSALVSNRHPIDQPLISHKQ